MKNLKFSLILISILWNSNLCLAQNEQDTLKVLFVGNSYTYYFNMPHLVSLISDSTQTKLITSKSTTGGARLSDHWNGKKGLKTKELIKNGKFDIVILQEQSMGTIEQPTEFLTYSKKFSDYIKENGAQPYFFCTWARQKVPQHQKVITSMYNKAAKENDAEILYVGDIWALAKKNRPEIELYLNDGSHPSQTGSFLTACAFVKILSKKLPDKLWNNYSLLDARDESIWLMRVESLDFTFCQMVVDKVVN